MKSKESEILANVRSGIRREEIARERDERELKFLDASRRRKEAYSAGYSLGLRGEILEKASLEDRENVSFIHGYKAGLKQFKSNLTRTKDDTHPIR